MDTKLKLRYLLDLLSMGMDTKFILLPTNVCQGGGRRAGQRTVVFGPIGRNGAKYCKNVDSSKGNFEIVQIVIRNRTYVFVIRV